MVAEPLDLISLRSTHATAPAVVVRVDPDSLEAEIIVDTAFVKGRHEFPLLPHHIAEWGEVLEALDDEEDGSWMEAAQKTVLTIEWDEEYDRIWVTVEDVVGAMVSVRVGIEPDEFWLDDQFERLAKFREASPRFPQD